MSEDHSFEGAALGCLILAGLIIFIVIVIAYIVFYLVLLFGAIGILWGIGTAIFNFGKALKDNLFKRSVTIT